MNDALNKSRQWYNEKLAKETIKSLEKNNMTACYVAGADEAFTVLMSMIPEGSKVGYGGALSLDQLGVKDALGSGNYQFIDRRNRGAGEAEQFRMRRESMFADVFLTSTNAITMQGQLVNIDGIGNRVAAMIFGPSKVIVVAGINKIVPDMEAAVYRIKNYVAPLHARRRGKKLPCARTGRCEDCHSPDRFCNALVVIEHQYLKNKGRIAVIIVGEELGL